MSWRQPGEYLSPEEVEVLRVLRMGIASLSGSTKTDKENGIHTVRKMTAMRLVENGYAHEVPHWNAVEITDKGISALGNTP